VEFRRPRWVTNEREGVRYEGDPAEDEATADGHLETTGRNVALFTARPRREELCHVPGAHRVDAALSAMAAASHNKGWRSQMATGTDDARPALAVLVQDTAKTPASAPMRSAGYPCTRS
jgi:hypothetical protein